MSVHAIIMAGGSGTRFWPLSRRAKPKQLLPLAGDRSLLAETVDRIAPIIAPENVLVVTNARLAEATANELPRVPRANVLAEPVGRNTAPCIGWAATHVMRRDPEGVIAVLPADHHIGDVPAFLAVMERAVDHASRGGIVTVGIHPTRPETGYGYIEIGEPIREGVFAAKRFVEKPNRMRAEQFLSAGGFVWNSGMFFFRADVILSEIRAHLPGLAKELDAIDRAAREGREAEVVDAVYGSLPSVSIDHGVMEKAQSVAVVPGTFAWSDLGGFATAWELASKDAEQNAMPEQGVAIDATANYVRAPAGKTVALIGVSDLVVVDTGDALLVMHRDRGEDVRKVVDIVAKRDETLL